jgi:hypothetical protein
MNKIKHILKVFFYLKGYGKGDVYFFLSITNVVLEFLELVFVLGFLVSFNYQVAAPFIFVFSFKHSSSPIIFCHGMIIIIRNLIVSKHCSKYF